MAVWKFAKIHVYQEFECSVQEFERSSAVCYKPKTSKARSLNVWCKSSNFDCPKPKTSEDKSSNVQTRSSNVQCKSLNVGTRVRTFSAEFSRTEPIKFCFALIPFPPFLLISRSFQRQFKHDLSLQCSTNNLFITPNLLLQSINPIYKSITKIKTKLTLTII